MTLSAPLDVCTFGGFVCGFLCLFGSGAFLHLVSGRGNARLLIECGNALGQDGCGSSRADSLFVYTAGVERVQSKILFIAMNK